MRLAPIICYEALFGEFVAGYVRKGANALCIITNDGWWGNTEGHRQMLWIARLRAIETRLPIIRSANTGVSAFLTPDGRITGVIPYGQQGALRGTLVLAERKPTFYVRWRYGWLRGCCFFRCCLAGGNDKNTILAV